MIPSHADFVSFVHNGELSSLCVEQNCELMNKMCASSSKWPVPICSQCFDAWGWFVRAFVHVQWKHCTCRARGKMFFLEIVLDVLETLDKSGCLSVCLVKWCHAHEPGNWTWLKINTGARALDLNMLSCKLTAGLGTMRTKLHSSTHCIDSIFFQGVMNVQNRS